MSSLVAAETRRRQLDQEQQQRKTLAAVNKKKVLDVANKAVRALLHEIGQQWGGIDVDNPPFTANRSWIDRVLQAPSSVTFARAYKIDTLGGPSSRGHDLTLKLGQAEWHGDCFKLVYKPGMEAGGLCVSLKYAGHDIAHYRLRALMPYLPVYSGEFISLDALRHAIWSEWARGTFIGPYRRFMPFHDTYPDHSGNGGQS